MDTTTLQGIIDAVSGFTDGYALYATAGVVLGLAFWGIKKLIKAGR
jgi:hypothetical protein